MFFVEAGIILGDAGLHAVRILAKRLRYATEAVAPASGRQALKSPGTR